MMASVTQLERLTALEVRVEELRDESKEIGKKLDDLLAMRNKGIGAFWLASSLIGTGMLGVFLQMIGWFKHG